MTTAERLAGIIAQHLGREGPLLPICHDVQAEFGCVDREAEAQIAEALNLSRAEVHGVVRAFIMISAPKPTRARQCSCAGQRPARRAVSKRLLRRANAPPGTG
jgi:formate dehydrogenase subunit gamma